MIPDFHMMKAQWRGGPYVPRGQVGVFSGGILHPRTMANLDCLGLGPPRVWHGKKVFYPVDGLVEWGQRRVAEKNLQGKKNQKGPG